MRLFVALAPDDGARAQLAEVSRRTQRHLGDLANALRWSQPDNIHLTLYFLGEVEEDRAATLRTALGDRLAVAPCEIVTGNLGTFPSGGPAKVLWLSVREGVREISRIHSELGRRLLDGGFPVDSRPLSAHITLARVRDRQRREAKHLIAALKGIRVDPIRWTVDKATLYRSHLSASAPRYEALQHVLLSDSDYN